MPNTKTKENEASLNKQFMGLAAKEAIFGVKNDHGGPFGATIVINNQVIAASHNMVVATGDPSSHAEVTTIRKAIEELKKENKNANLEKAIIYSSCEPCPMCLAAICQAGIKELYIGATREDAKNADFDDSFIYDVFSGKSDTKQIDLKNISDIKNYINSEYNIDVTNSKNNAWIFEVTRDNQGKVINAKIASEAKDDFDKTKDPTSYGAINAIRDLTKKNKNFDLSKYEMVTLFDPRPLTFATMHWAKLTNVVSGTQKEPDNGINHKDVLNTINAIEGKSLVKTKQIEREACLKAFKEWQNKLDRVNY